MLRRLLDAQLFQIGDTYLTVSTLALSILIVFLSFVLSRVLRAIVRRAFARRGVVHDRTGGVVAQFLHYALVLTGLAIALQTAGIEIGALFAAGAVFAIGLGFAMQDIAQNFVAGVILLVERAIKPGDVIEVDGHVVRVVEMGIRTTTVRTRFDEDMIVPNSRLAQSTVKNYTHGDSHYRLRADVGVAYSSDLKVVIATLERVARAVEWRVAGKDPLVLLTSFGASAVNLEVSVWCSDPWKARIALSELHLAIWFAFHDAKIAIAFPQVDVHLAPAMEAGIARLLDAAPRDPRPAAKSAETADA
jgi:small-conductance mechanosensitive channel